MDVRIEQSWKEALKDEFAKPYFTSLVQYLHKEKAEGRQIFPPEGRYSRPLSLHLLTRSRSSFWGRIPTT